MKARGFSLVEMIVALAVASILLAIGTLKFNAYLKRYRSEAQTRMIHAELQRARAKAVYQRRETLVKMYRDRFEIYSSARDDSHGAAPVRTQKLDFPVVCSGGGSEVKIYFDEKGICTAQNSICLDDDSSAVVDSVVVAKVRTRIGKKEMGEACANDNIESR